VKKNASRKISLITLFLRLFFNCHDDISGESPEYDNNFKIRCLILLHPMRH